MNLRPCTYEEIQHFAKAAAKEGSAIKPKSCECRYWGVWADGKPVACAFAALVSKTKVRLSGAYVLPAYRGKGLWRQLYDVRMAYARSQPGVVIVESFLRPSTLPMYMRRGWTLRKSYTATYHVTIGLGGTNERPLL
jgi:GNAT superfamily N-acetyltransferase